MHDREEQEYVVAQAFPPINRSPEEGVRSFEKIYISTVV